MTRLAIFDFDRTLITGDSFIPFLCCVAGRTRTYAAIVESLARLAVRPSKEKGVDPPTFLKAFLIDRLLKGKKIADLEDALKDLSLWQDLNLKIVHRLLDHHKRGDTIVIASGGLDIYLPTLLEDLPHTALICTEIGQKDGVLTGQMTKGNCVRLLKAQRVHEWMEENGPFEETFGYGNAPHDLPMLDLVKHRVVVS